jgi:uncharacterized membrane protein
MRLREISDRVRDSAAVADDIAGGVEALALTVVSRVAVWVAAIPTVALTSRTAAVVFGLSNGAALAAAVALEVCGQAVVSLWLDAKAYNATKRKADPPASDGLALAMTLVYFVTDFILVGVLEVPKALDDPVHWAALLFPLMQVVSTITLVERAKHFRRLAEIAQVDAERARERAMLRQERRGVAQVDAEAAQVDAKVALPLTPQERRAQLLALWAQDGRKSFTALSKIFDVSRQTISNDFAALVESGHMRRNGRGVEVVGVQSDSGM